MLDHLEFVTKGKSMLIAPAGFGKTHTIAECLKHTQNKGKQLILTHTHAGVASIKEKIKKEGIPYSSYEVETITSFAQKYVLSFYIGKLPFEQENPKKYYPFIINEAISLFKLAPIKQIVSNTYTGLFVDEYQDCTVKQHELILLLSELFPTHILGDFLQGIFGFNGEQLVDMLNPADMKDFLVTKYELDKPQRWLNGNNASLGESLKEIRRLLEDCEEVNLSNYKASIEVVKMKKSDEFLEFEVKSDTGGKIKNPLNKRIWDLKKEYSLLMLYPNNEKNRNSAPRELFIKLFGDDFKLLEAIDDKLFYKYSKLFDETTSKNISKDLNSILSKCYTKKCLDYWFKNSNLENNELALFKPISDNIGKLKKEINKQIIGETMRMIHSLPKMKCIRKEIISSVIYSLQEAYLNNCSVYESMINRRNSIRRVGRKVIGKCVGTTLLTKGLEFDTVVILNAHEFDCPKHLYVAMTRASKRLLIFTENLALSPYKTNVQ